jgi:hypothetical protein
MTTTKIDETLTVDWTRYQGDSLTIDIEEVDSTGAAVDYTGATPRLQVGTITETTSGVVVTNGLTAGTLSFFIPDTVMATLAVDEYDIAVEVYYSATHIRRTLFTGTLTLIEDVRT